MRILSKSKLLAYRQCPKKLWLEFHRPDLHASSAGAQARITIGHQVGDIARRLYDPAGKGRLIEITDGGVAAAIARTQELIRRPLPLFEAGFQATGALAMADILLPVPRKGWRMVEVKSSAEVKDYHRDDVAIQAFVARAAGLKLQGIAVAHVDSGWSYPGHEDYAGLLVEQDLSEEAFARADEVQDWIAGAQRVAAGRKPPAVATGSQCGKPFECGFAEHCRSQEPQVAHRVLWLPRLSAAQKDFIAQQGLSELRDMPDDRLDAQQRRVKTVTLSGRPWFDQTAAAQALAAHKLPAYFIDFETIQFAVPIWKGTRPYQQIPFQFSVHRLSRTGQLVETPFLDLSGKDPSRAFAEALLAACGSRGPVFVYNIGFERGRITELAARFPRLAAALQALSARLVDLLPIARDHFYHPSQQGSWSIKAVLPALCPDLSYANLDGVQDGGMAMTAYLEALAPSTTIARKQQIERQLLDYCRLDTYAMVRLWSAFTGSALTR